MSQGTELANRFREVFLDGTFVAYTNYKAQLTTLNRETAFTRVSNLNTIAALTFHIHYYVAGILHVFRGGTLDIRDQYAWDMPEMPEESDWEQLKERFWADAEAYAQHVEQLTTDELDAFFVDEKYGTMRRNIDAMIEHAYYHLGQISLIKKMIETNTSYTS
ncbi:MAG: DinB family protein [Flavobacteriales bacterium]|nr:DinB family protein [Bacteroidota bacterium]MCB9240923.1 DinB family protein [Flavobacteriales bacterium]